MDELLKRLLQIRDDLVQIMKTSGTGQRVQEYKEDILKLGWAKAQYKYHPDNNLDDPARNEVYAMVKFIYESMLRNGEV